MEMASLRQNAGGSMIADPDIAEPIKEDEGPHCYWCGGLATQKITNTLTGVKMELCVNHITPLWIALEALDVNNDLEIGDLK